MASEAVIQDLRCVLLPIKGGADILELQRGYRDVTGENIPYREMGFNSVEQLLAAYPKEFRVCGSSYSGIKIHVVIKGDSEHIARMVAAQPNRKKKTRGGSRNVFALGYSRNFSTNQFRPAPIRRPLTSNYQPMQGRIVRTTPKASSKPSPMNQLTITVFNERAGTYEKVEQASSKTMTTVKKPTPTTQKRLSAVAPARLVVQPNKVFNESTGKFEIEGQQSTPERSSNTPPVISPLIRPAHSGWVKSPEAVFKDHPPMIPAKGINISAKAFVPKAEVKKPSKVWDDASGSWVDDSDKKPSASAPVTPMSSNSNNHLSNWSSSASLIRQTTEDEDSWEDLDSSVPTPELTPSAARYDTQNRDSSGSSSFDSASLRNCLIRRERRLARKKEVSDQIKEDQEMRFNNVLLKQLVALKISESTPKPQFTGGFNAAGYGLNRPVSPQKVKIIDSRPILRFLGGLKGTVAARIRPQGPEAKRESVTPPVNVAEPTNTVPKKDILKRATSQEDAEKFLARRNMYKMVALDLYEVLKKFPSGVFTTDLPEKYNEKFNLDLPENWVEEIVIKNPQLFEVADLRCGNIFSRKIVYPVKF